MLRSVLRAMLSAVVGASMVGPVNAEPGDYTDLQTFYNLFVPETADDPVSNAETQGPYPLNTPTAGFDDGFEANGYFRWQQVDVPVETGAACGNGTPYKFFVRRVPNKSNLLFYFEGGGACWDYPSCSGAAGVRGARNPEGIPDNYVQNIQLLDLDTLGYIGTGGASPLIYTNHPYERFKTSEWNMVYVPYCTGDIYVGDKVQVYEDPEGVEPDLVWHHNGLRNVQSVVSWVKNNLRTPAQLLSTGCSAGGVGALANYSKLRGHFNVQYAYLLDDSGPLFNAPVSSNDVNSYPSLLLHREVIDTWTNYGSGSGDSPLSMLEALTPGFEPERLASLYAALSAKYPNDRMGMTYFLADGNFSSYSYERFYPPIRDLADPEAKLNFLRAVWQIDTWYNLLPLLEATNNWGYHLPMYRDLNESHCTSIVDFRYTEIEELGTDLTDFLNNTVNYQGGPPLRGLETDPVSDFINNHDWFYVLIDSIL